MTLANRIVQKAQLPFLLEQRRLINDQRRLIDYLINERENLRRSNLELVRDKQGIVSGWLLSLEQPDNDVREELWVLVRSLGEQIAMLEEHVVS
jgi:hypothetical protein